MSANDPTPSEPELAALTTQHFPQWPGEGEFAISEIKKGGSGRRFFRFARGGRSLIVMHYTLDRPENADFAPITDFLAAQAVPVPAIEARDTERQLLWIEDLGGDDLWCLRDADWDSVRRPTYETTLRAVRQIHALNETDLADQPELPHFQPPFDAAMYRWEQDYFFERYVERFAPVDAAERAAIRENPQLAGLIEGLVALPRTLVHRDFQSENVMLPGGAPRLIDYQGMRYGRPEYDIASLLFDPYVPFSAAQRDQLARYYHGLVNADLAEPEPFDLFEDRLLRCGAQRLMQALGAYGFLGLVRGQKEFLEHIPPALATLQWIAVERGVLPTLAPVLKPGEKRVA